MPLSLLKVHQSSASVWEMQNAHPPIHSFQMHYIQIKDPYQRGLSKSCVKLRIFCSSP